MKVLKFPDWRLALTLVGSSLLIAAASAADPAKPTRPAAVPGLVQYQTPEGINYSALVLPSPAAPSVAAVAHDHVIENEVMKITTKTDGIAKRPIRVYNVGDLVKSMGQAFAQIQDPTEPSTLNGATLKDRKKKQLSSR